MEIIRLIYTQKENNNKIPKYKINTQNYNVRKLLTSVYYRYMHVLANICYQIKRKYQNIIWLFYS